MNLKLKKQTPTIELKNNWLKSNKLKTGFNFHL